jgi:UDP-2,3-diacylglucosamine pyrophosphatase LpxH
VLGHALVVVSDAHLGVAPPRSRALLSFWRRSRIWGLSLVNGDLFDFWFSYARVIPRRGFHVAAALDRLRRRVPIVMVGGNHDRWGGDFWARDVGVVDPHRVTFDIGRRRVAAITATG